MSTTILYFPQRPYSLVDAINRMALATGSVRAAQQAAGADYNGHRVSVAWSDYRKSWSASYTWGGLQWLVRGAGFEEALTVAMREFDRGALGAEVEVECQTEEQIEACRARGFVTEEEADALKSRWKDERFSCVNEAIDLERKQGISATSLLLLSATVAEFRGRVDAAYAERRAGRRVPAP